jgi:hypothetical protein
MLLNASRKSSIAVLHRGDAERPNRHSHAEHGNEGTLSRSPTRREPSIDGPFRNQS